ncbi:MAG: alpha/beta fold hydrolase [Actinomycetota bacterium]
MTTFALVHGAYHCGAHFDLLAAELRARSHDVVAPDLPITSASAGAKDYASVIVNAVGRADDVVVVGHSMGGLSAPIAAWMIPSARALVYLSALVATPGRSFDDSMDPDYPLREPQASPRANSDGSASSHPAHACEMWYHDCGWENARWACSLLRPQHWLASQEVTPLEQHPTMPTTFIVASNDRAINPIAMRRIARERLSADIIEIESGHSSFISKPKELAEILSKI